MAKIGVCIKCGKELHNNIYGNMCRKSERYCKECWLSLSKKEKDLIDWHFSQDML